jgi:hypothetical protein
MNDYIITIPNSETYKYLLWDFLADKKFQIHKVSITLQGLVLLGTFYFNPALINDFMLSRVGADYVKAIGKVQFEKRIKPPKRKWVRRKPVEAKNLSQQN